MQLLLTNTLNGESMGLGLMVLEIIPRNISVLLKNIKIIKLLNIVVPTNKSYHKVVGE